MSKPDRLSDHSGVDQPSEVTLANKFQWLATIAASVITGTGSLFGIAVGNPTYAWLVGLGMLCAGAGMLIWSVTNRRSGIAKWVGYLSLVPLGFGILAIWPLNRASLPLQTLSPPTSVTNSVSSHPEQSYGGGYTGLTTNDIDAQTADRLGLSDNSGVWVSGVADGSPAARAGIRVNDVIRSFGGLSVKNSADLIRRVHNSAPDTKFVLVIWRDGGAISRDIVIGSQP